MSDAGGKRPPADGAASDEEEADEARLDMLKALKRPELDEFVADVEKAKAAKAAAAAAGGAAAAAPGGAAAAAAAGGLSAEEARKREELAATARALLGFNPAAAAASADKKAQLKLAMGQGSKEEAEKADQAHRFWSTQPVPKLAQAAAAEHCPIDAPRTIAEVKAEPYPLPAGFEWCTLDVNDKAQLSEAYELLAANYVEDDDAMFRFAYPADFLHWALTPPHYLPDWHVGVRVSKSKRLVACITGVPAAMEAYGRQRRMCEINYLCVDKKLRSKRLAPVLIKEVTRRVNRTGVWQAAYTAGVVLPKPVASCRYWHRSIDPKKLIDVGFSRLGPRMTMQRTQRLYKLPDAPVTGGIRPMQPRDVPSATLALNAYLGRYALRPVLEESEVAHWLLPRKGIVDCFVVTKRVTRAEARAQALQAAAAIVARREAWLAEHPGSGSWGAPEGGAAGAPIPGEDTAVPPPVNWEALAERVAGAPPASAAAAAGGAAGSSAAGGSGGAGAGAGAGAGDDDGSVEVVTDLVSFYHLPSTVIGNAKHSHLYAAYLYYYVAEGQVPLRQLLEDALILARDAGIDVVNCLDLMDNAPHLEALKFGPGDGNLQYYLFNWACPQMEPKHLGLVLH